MSRLTAKSAAHSAATETKHAKDYAMEYVVPHLATARDAVVPVLGHARDAAAPHLAIARDRIKGDVMPRVSAGVAAGLAAAEPVRDEAVRRGGAAYGALRGQIMDAVPTKKKHHGRRNVGIALIVVAAGAAGAAAWKAWKLPHDSDDWVHADTYTGGNIPSTNATTDPEPTPADVLAEELRVRNGKISDPIAR